MEDAEKEKLLSNNPMAARDREVMEEALSIVRDRREAGVAPRTYGLAPPFGGARSLQARKIVIDTSS